MSGGILSKPELDEIAPLESPPDPTVQKAAANPLKLPAFRRVWIGATISMFGDQYYLVALPWIVLQITGSGLALGTILTAAAVPRALFMLIGGVASDRFRPQSVFVLTAWIRFVLVFVLGALIYVSRVELWQIYVLAAVFGLTDAFALPASQALIPALVRHSHLSAANSLMMGSAQISAILGAATAGLVVKHWGVRWAFFVDAFSFLFLIAALVQLPRIATSASATRQQKGIGRAIWEGLRYVFDRPAIRSLTAITGAINFFVVGPLVVGMAVLSKRQFGSASSFGMFVATLSAGGLIGALIPILTKRRSQLGAGFLATCGGIGLCMVSIGFIHEVFAIAVVLLALGMAAGWINVNVQTWIQARVKPELLGRVVSVLTFVGIGLVPLSYSLAGFLIQVNLRLMFCLSGLSILLVTAIVARGIYENNGPS
jgi:MFS family permease